MDNKEAFLDACKGLVMNCNVQVLILEIMGEYRAFLVNGGVGVKTRESRYNEVYDAQDITKLIGNVGINFASGMTEQVLRERAQSIPQETFKFGTDNYMWITGVKLNR